MCFLRAVRMQANSAVKIIDYKRVILTVKPDSHNAYITSLKSVETETSKMYRKKAHIFTRLRAGVPK
jgi:hypothetical protein